MNKLLTKISALCLGATMLFGAVTGVSKSSKEVKAGSTKTVELCTSWNQTLAYATSYSHNYLINDFAGNTVNLSLSVQGVYRQSSANTYFQMNKRSGYFKNTTGFPGKILKIDTVWSTNSGPTKCFFAENTEASSSDSIVNVSNGLNVTYTAPSDTNYYFFNIDVSSGSGSAQMTSCVVTYEEVTGPVKTLSSIAVTTPPTKTVYTVGEIFDPSGMVVTATYSDETTSDITSSCTYSPNPIADGTTQILITYNGKTAFQPITVEAAPEFIKLTDLNVADKVFITSSKNSVSYLLSSATTSDAPLASSVTISDNKLSGVSVTNLFTVSKNSSGQFAFQNKDGKYLANTSNNNGVRISSTSASYWTVTATPNGFKMTNNSRWLGVYQESDWRSYTTSDADNYGGSGESINFYGITKEVAPLEEIELLNYPTSDLEIGATGQFTYYGLDSEAEIWFGNVTYTTSNSSVLYVDSETGEFRAVGAGTSNITVYAMAGENGAKIESEVVTITVLGEPERIDLPIGNYFVDISALGKRSGDPIPDGSFEIKEKEGRTWYKNLTASFTGMSVQYANEYTLVANSGEILFSNHSNAKIASISIDWYISATHDASDLYVGSSSSPQPYSVETGGSGSIYLYNLYTNESTIRISNNTSSTSSFYSIKINFVVSAENEEFHSLIVSKDPSWNKTSYKDGETPSNEGLVVTARFSNDNGATISRTQDVTNQVSSWTYNPSTLHLDDTSFTVVTVWSGHESNVLTVTGITVSPLTGPLANGRYYIMTSDDQFGLSAEESVDSKPEAIDLTISNSLTAFDVNLVADNEYEISTTVGGVKYYLVNNSTATSSANTNIRITSSPISGLKSINWVLDAVEGGYNIKQNTTGSYYRYLSCYESSTVNDWRGYLNTNSGNPVLKFVEEDSYAELIANSLLDDLVCDNGVTKPSTTVWSTIATEFAKITIEHEKDLLTNGAANVDSSNIIEQALAKYDLIVSKYGESLYSNFLGRSLVQSSPAIHPILSDSTSFATIIVVLSIASVTIVGALVIVRKHKEN